MMRYRWFIAAAPLLIGVPLLAQARPHGGNSTSDSANSGTHVSLRPRALAAARLTGTPPTIDGRLDEAIWTHAPVARGFVQWGPHPGAPARWRTEARVAYDERAVYVAMRMYDPRPDSILAPERERDDETGSDWAFVDFDSRHDRRNALAFGLSPRGVQADGAWRDDAHYDGTWDSVWQGAARIDSLGWTAEFRIPLSQLPHGADHDGSTVWGVNFYRSVARSAETSNWSPRFPSVPGVVSHFNTLIMLAIRVPPAH